MTQITVSGVKQTLEAFSALPKRIRRKHLTIAMNAGGGIVRDRASQIVRRQSGLLSKQLGVKVSGTKSIGQDDSKPVTASVGAKRRAGRFMRLKGTGLKGFGVAQRALTAERKRLKAEGKLPPLQRERAAVAAIAKQHSDAIYRNPSRYAHLVEKGHKKGKGRGAAQAYPFLTPALNQTKSQAVAKIGDKLKQGFSEEAKALYVRT